MSAAESQLPLPARTPASPCGAVVPACGDRPALRLHRPGSRAVALSDLTAGQRARVVRVNLPDLGCKRRFAELGLAPGMSVTVISTGDTLMLDLAGGKFGVASRCAADIQVIAL